MTKTFNSGISRRDFGKLATGGLTVAGVGGGVISSASAQAAISGVTGRPADLPAAKGRRVVVVGGGWSGLTVAKYLKVNDPNLDVVLIERRATFKSHPMSGLWIAGVTSLETLTYI